MYNNENWVHYFACAHCQKQFAETDPGVKIWKDWAFCSQECEDKGVDYSKVNWGTVPYLPRLWNR